MHETDRCRSLKFLVEKLVKARHLKRYIKEDDHIKESGPVADRIATRATTSSKPSLVINYILGVPSDDQYQSKHQQKKILRATTIKSRVNDIHKEDSREETKPIDGPTMMHWYSPSVLAVLMCIGYWWILAVQWICCNYPPSTR